MPREGPVLLVRCSIELSWLVFEREKKLRHLCPIKDLSFALLKVSRIFTFEEPNGIKLPVWSSRQGNDRRAERERIYIHPSDFVEEVLVMVIPAVA